MSPLKTTSLLIIIAGVILWCCGKQTTSTHSTELPFLNLHDSVSYVGMETCVSCHKDVHEDYLETGMGKSFNLATKEKSAGIFDQRALVYDTLKNFYYQPFWSGDTMKLREFRLAGEDTIYQRIETIHYIVGSGQHTNSHMTQVNGYLYQAPITFYTQTEKWDLPPGFENGNNSRFDRTIGIECMTCHNHLPQFDEASENRFTKIPTGIECERCHGPGELHVNKMLRGEFVDTASQADYTIVKPSRLNIEQQMSLCQRCHLQGITVLKEGKSFYDFRPGMELSDIMNVFIARFSTDDEFIMASQADRLRMSECFVESEQMSCITCHDPHQSVQTTPRAVFNTSCESCHQSERSFCTESIEARKINNNDCSGCHMPKSGSVDIPHVSITDHRIQIPRVDDSKKEAIKRFVELECRTDENASDIIMAQGYLAYYEKFGGGEESLDRAFQLLSNYRDDKDLLFIQTQIHYWFLKNETSSILDWVQKTDFFDNTDPWTNYRIAEAYTSNRQHEQALEYIIKALEQKSRHLDFMIKKGNTLTALNRWQDAKQVYQQILNLNPKYIKAITNLGFVLIQEGQPNAAIDLYQRALNLDPDNEQALLNMAGAYFYLNKLEEGQKYLERCLIVNPANAKAIEIQQQLNSM